MTVAYSTADGSAGAARDYTAASGTVTSAPGELAKSVDVPVAGDGQHELDERFHFAIGNPTNAQLENRIATCVLVNEASGRRRSAQ